MKRLKEFSEVKEVLNEREAARLLEQGWIPLATRTIGEYQPGILHPTLIYRFGRPTPPLRRPH